MKLSIPFLDRMLTPAECAAWLQMPERELGKKFRQGIVPGAKFGHNTIRYNPRTIIESRKARL